MLLCLIAQMTEAENLYKQCVHDAQGHHDELERVKEMIIIHIRKLICQGDTVLKEVSRRCCFGCVWKCTDIREYKQPQYG